MTVYAFGEYRVDSDRMLALGPAGPLTAEPQVFDVLLYLIRQNGRVVTKEELLDNVWGDRFVSESALTTRIKQARRLVGDDGQAQSTILTIRGRGFRFVPDIRIDPPADDDRAVPPTARTPERAAATGATDPTGTARRPLPRELDIEQRRPFVGRDAEVASAVALIDRPAASSARWIVLLGEPGIGKTRLAARIAQLTSDRGAVVLLGRCSEDLAVPFEPAIEVLRTAIDRLADDELVPRLGAGASELARLLPDLAVRLPELAVPHDADPQTARYRMFEAFAAWLDAMSRHEAVTVVIDDVHWATESTLHLVGHLARRLAAPDVTIVITARDTAPDLRPALDHLITAIESHAQHETIRMRGLDVDATRLLLDADSDVHLDAEDVVAQTAGNPLLIAAMVGGDGGVGIAAAVARRMARLDRSVKDALIVAAMVGAEFDVKVVAHALERDELTLIDDLDTAVDARLLDDVGGDHYRFAHALVRATLREEMSAPRRARWHGRIAEAMEQIHARDLRAVAPALAHHYAEASSSNPSLRRVAIEHLRNASRHAVAQLSFGEAVDLLIRARALSGAGADDAGLRAELAIECGDAEARAGRHVPAMRSFDAASLDAGRAGRSDLMIEAALRYEDTSWRPGRSGGLSIERLTTALELVGPDDVQRRARLQIALTRAHTMAGDADRADVAFRRAEELVVQLADPLLEARALGARCFGDVDVFPPQPIATVLRLRALCDVIDDVDVQLVGRQVHLRTMIRLGRLEDYRIGLREMSAIVDGLHSTFWAYIRANHEAMLVLYDGDLVGAEQAAAHCANVAGDLVEEDTSGTLGLRMFLIRREQDRLAHLAPVVRQLIAGDSTASYWTPGLALLLAEIGHRREAQAMLDEFRAHHFDLPADAMWATVMAMLIELATTLEDTPSCRLLYEAFAVQSGTAVVTGHGIACLGAADRYLGMLAATLGDMDSAEAHLVRAVAFDEGNGGVLWASHARLHLSRVWRRQGRIAVADAALESVRATASEHGFAALQRLADRR